MKQPSTIAEGLERAALRATERTLDLEARHVLERVAARLTGRQEDVLIGRYRLGARLGHGGCGLVHAGFDPKLEREVAIKFVRPVGDDAADAEARLVREAQALAKLRHPNVVEVFDVGIDELVGAGGKRRGVYIVMELVHGPTLADWLEQPRPTETILDMFEQAARGLAAAHAAGVIHRDFKPSNAMIAGERLKVLDFGLAREELRSTSTRHCDEEVGSAEIDAALTRTGTLLGTPRYMAPEQHAGKDVDPRVDQFAWCVALWEALAGAPPFDARELGMLGAQKRRGPPARPATGHVSTRMYRVLARGMQPDPARRFRDMDELSRSLGVARRGSGRARLALGGTAIAIAAMAFATTRAPSLPPACEAEIPSAWSPSEIQRITDALATSPVDPRWGLHVRVAARVHRFVERWTDTRAKLCDPDATTLAEPERRERLACLERGRARLDRILAVYAEGGSGVMAAHQRLWSSETPAACLLEAPATIFARSEEEEAELDEHGAVIVELLSADLAQMEPRMHEVERMLERAHALHEPTLAIRALIARGRYERSRAEHAKAAATLQEAAWRAEANDDALLACEQMPLALSSLQASGASNQDIDRLFQHAYAMLEKAGQPLDVSLALDAQRMLAVAQRGDTKQAVAIGEAALQRGLEARVPGTERDLHEILCLLGQIHWDWGLFAVARGEIQRALEIAPPQAPWYASATAHAHRTLAVISYMEGAEEAAIRETLAAIEGLSGKTIRDPELQNIVALYGFLLFELGQEVEGEAHLRHTVDVLMLDHGFSVPQLGAALGNLALVQLGRHDFEIALATADQHLEFEIARESKVGQTRAYFQRAAAELGLGRIDAAERDVDRGFLLMDFEREGYVLRAEIELAREQWDRAQEHALRALLGYHPAQGGRRANSGRGRSYWILARAAHGRRENADAIELAELAASYYERGTAADRVRVLPAVQRWLADRRARSVGGR